MITPDFYMNEGVYYKREIFWGLSTDIKPTHVANGSVFIEMDTSKVYFFDADNAVWLEWGAESEESNEVSNLSISRPNITLGNYVPTDAIDTEGGEGE